MSKGIRFNISSDQQQNRILNCKPTEDCQLYCNYANGCNNITLNCPSNYKCYIQCYNPNDIYSGYSCNSLTINATKSSYLEIDVFQQSQQFMNSVIYAPNDIYTDIKCQEIAHGMLQNVCRNNTIYNMNNLLIANNLQCPCNMGMTSTITSDTDNILDTLFESDPLIIIADILLISTVLLIISLTMGQCIAHNKSSYYNTDHPPYYHIMFYFITVATCYTQLLFTILQLHLFGPTFINLLCLLFIIIPFIVSIVVAKY